VVKNPLCLEKANQMLYLSESYWFGNECFGKEMFIRQSYLDLAQKITRIFLLRTYTAGVALTGTPGIGKSQFLAFLFCYLYQNVDSLNTFVISSVYMNETLIVRRPSLQVTSVDLDDRKSIGSCDKESALCLFDTGFDQKLPVQYPLFLIAACSPAVGCEAFLQQGDSVSAHTLFMPLWSLDELETANKQSKLYCDSKALKKLRRKVGGTIRYTLKRLQLKAIFKDTNADQARSETKERMKCCLDEFHQFVDCVTIADSAGNIKLKEHVKKNTNALYLIHHMDTFMEFESYTSVFASPYIQKLLYNSAPSKAILESEVSMYVCQT
jgi:hypothetical protein